MAIQTIPAVSSAGLNRYAVRYLTTASFVTPATCNSVDVFLVGGGGGAGNASQLSPGSTEGNSSGGGGGGGILRETIAVVPGTTYTVTIGAGGTGATTAGTNATAGANTTFGSLATAYGGGAGVGVRSTAGPTRTYYSTNKDGGCGGGGAYADTGSRIGGLGGSAAGAIIANDSIGLAWQKTDAGDTAQGAIGLGSQGGSGLPNSSASLLQAIGYFGFGVGGLGGQAGTTSRPYLGPNGYSVAMNNDVQGTTGTAGAANRGMGGNGSAVRGNSTYAGSGGNGGSGFAYIVYWAQGEYVMAHFSQLDDSNKVINVIVIDNNVTHDSDGVEQESLGISFCKSLYGESTKWVQTSYSNSKRGVFGGIGMTYDEVNDVFIPDATGVIQEPIVEETPID